MRPAARPDGEQRHRDRRRGGRIWGQVPLFTTGRRWCPTLFWPPFCNRRVPLPLAGVSGPRRPLRSRNLVPWCGAAAAAVVVAAADADADRSSVPPPCGSSSSGWCRKRAAVLAMTWGAPTRRCCIVLAAGGASACHRPVWSPWRRRR